MSIDKCSKAFNPDVIHCYKKHTRRPGAVAETADRTAYDALINDHLVNLILSHVRSMSHLCKILAHK